MNFKIGEKGQGLLVDMVAAIIIFLIISTSITWIWTNKAAGAETIMRENELGKMAETSLDTLVRSKGIPEDWESQAMGDIGVIGLAKRDRVLEKGKVDQFVLLATTDYETVKQKLLVGSYDYYFRLIDPETGLILQNDIGTYLEAGSAPDTGKSMWQASVKRTAIYEGGSAIAELTLYWER